MKSVAKALRDLAEAVKNNDTVAKVDVKITLKKPKPLKTKPKADK